MKNHSLYRFTDRGRGNCLTYSPNATSSVDLDQWERRYANSRIFSEVESVMMSERPLLLQLVWLASALWTRGRQSTAAMV